MPFGFGRDVPDPLFLLRHDFSSPIGVSAHGKAAVQSVCVNGTNRKF